MCSTLRVPVSVPPTRTLILGRDDQVLEETLRLVPGQNHLQPIELSLDGESILVGRMTHGIPAELKQVSRRAMTLDFKDGSLYLHNTGGGHVRVVGRSGGGRLIATAAPTELQPGECIQLLIRKAYSSSYVPAASWHVPMGSTLVSPLSPDSVGTPVSSGIRDPRVSRRHLRVASNPPSVTAIGQNAVIVSCEAIGFRKQLTRDWAFTLDPRHVYCLDLVDTDAAESALNGCAAGYETDPCRYSIEVVKDEVLLRPIVLAAGAFGLARIKEAPAMAGGGAAAGGAAVKEVNAKENAPPQMRAEKARLRLPARPHARTPARPLLRREHAVRLEPRQRPWLARARVGPGPGSPHHRRR